MKNLREQRRSKRLTLRQLSEKTGIQTSYLSEMEHGLFKPKEFTRNKIEKVLGKIDWTETEGIQIEGTSYYDAERLVKKLVSISLLLADPEKNDLTQLIHKYFKLNK